MRTESGYRFTLQFPNKTDQQRFIGEYLEGLGSKKSSFIVTALSEHLTQPPMRAQACIANLSRNELKDIIREALAERSLVIQLPDGTPSEESGDTSINAMLDFMGNL